MRNGLRCDTSRPIEWDDVSSLNLRQLARSFELLAAEVDSSAYLSNRPAVKFTEREDIRPGHKTPRRLYFFGKVRTVHPQKEVLREICWLGKIEGGLLSEFRGLRESKSHCRTECGCGPRPIQTFESSPTGINSLPTARLVSRREWGGLPRKDQSGLSSAQSLVQLPTVWKTKSIAAE